MKKSYAFNIVTLGILLSGCSAKSTSPYPQQTTPTSDQIAPGINNNKISSGTGFESNDQNFTYQTITNSEYKFSFQIPNDWTVQSRSARNAITYQSPNQHAIVNSYGFSKSDGYTTETSFLDNQWRFNIPSKSKMSYFSDGVRGSWTWLAESWDDSGTINYALIYLNGDIGNLVEFQYPDNEKVHWDKIVTHAVYSFVPSNQ